MLAIGSYYKSFVNEGTSVNKSHEHYYRLGAALLNVENPERSLNQVACLIAKCFYLLAVSKTDRLLFAAHHTSLYLTTVVVG